MEALGAALRCKLVMVQTTRGPHTVASETRAMRAALDRIAGLHSEADELLDQLETAAGLVDPNTGKRIDE